MTRKPPHRDPDVPRLMLMLVELTGGLNKRALFVLMEALLADRSGNEACEMLQRASDKYADVPNERPR